MQALAYGDHSRPRAGTLQRLLGNHPAFSHWPGTQIALLEGHTQLRELAPEETLLSLGSTEPFIHFLLQGSVALTANDGVERLVTEGSPDAAHPIARLRPAMYAVCARAPSLLLCVEQAVLHRLAEAAPKARSRARFDLFCASVGGTWQDHPLVAELDAAIAAQQLALPAIPAVALKVRKAIADENFQLSDLARVISVDPVISAKLLRLANSALFRGVSDCDSLQAAVVRLGVNKVQNLVLALATAGLFQAQDPTIKRLLAGTWRHLLDIGTLAAALARLGGRLDADVALLAGLLHEIGKLPLLERAARHPDLLAHPGLLDDIMAGIGPVVSVATLRQWRLPEPLIDAAEHQHNWGHEHAGDTSYTDLLIVAHLHASTHDREAHGMPRLTETPAFSRVTGARLSASESLGVIREAAQATGDLKALLR
ncbi:MAG: HDOD domain-containing protein [Pseudomonadota bacterium]